MVTDVSEQHTDPIFKGQAAKEDDPENHLRWGRRPLTSVTNPFAVQHSRRTKTTLQLHYKDQLIFTVQADFIVRIKVGTKLVFDRWDTMEMKYVLKVVIMKWRSSALQYHVVL